MEDEYVWDPDQDGNRTTQEVQVLATGILVELERLSNQYKIEISDMSHLLRLVTSSLKELDVVVEEGVRTSAENSRIRSEIAEAEKTLRVEQQCRQAAEKRWLAVNDQADSDRRMLETQVQALRTQVHQAKQKVSAKEEHYQRLLEDLTEIQQQHTEDRNRHALTVRGYSQQIESLERKVEEARNHVLSSLEPVSSDDDALSSEEDIKPACVPASNDVVDAPAEVQAEPKLSETASNTSEIPASEQESNRDTLTSLPVMMTGNGPAPKPAIPQVQHFLKRSTSSPQTSLRALSLSRKRSAFLSSTSTPGRTASTGRSYELKQSSLSISPPASLRNEDAICLQAELMEAVSSSAEHTALLETLEERLADALDERASVMRERADLKLSVANLSSDLTCCQQEQDRLQQLVAHLSDSLEMARKGKNEAQTSQPVPGSPGKHAAAVPNAGVQYKKDAERLMRLYAFYKDKSSMLQEQLSRMQMERTPDDSGIMRTFSKLFSFKKRVGRSASTSPMKQQQQQPVARTYSVQPISPHNVGSEWLNVSPSAESAKGLESTIANHFSPRHPGRSSVLDSPCSIGQPPTPATVSTRGDWIISSDLPRQELPLFPACAEQATLLAPPHSRIGGCAAVVLCSKSSTMPVSDISTAVNSDSSESVLQRDASDSSLTDTDSYRQLWVASFASESQVEILDVYSRGSLRHTGKKCPLPVSHSGYQITSITCVTSVPRRFARQTPFGSPDLPKSHLLEESAGPYGPSCVSRSASANSVPISCSVASVSAARAFKSVGEDVPTVWIAMGCYGGTLLIYSAEGGNGRFLESVQMEARGSVICVYNAFDRVFVGLSDCTIAAFDPDEATDSSWNVRMWQTQGLSSFMDEIDADYVRRATGVSNALCLAAVNDQLWCTCGRTVLILEPCTLQLKSSFRITFPPISQVLSVDNVVIFASNLSPFILFYHAPSCRLLQDFDLPSLTCLVDVSTEPLIGVTSMALSGRSLWLGCSNGVMVMLPLHATRRQVEKADTSTAAAGTKWREGSGVVSYESARVSPWVHMSAVSAMTPVSVRGSGVLSRKVHEVVFSCGVGSLDMRAAGDVDFSTRSAVLRRSSTPVSAPPTDPLHHFQHAQEREERLQRESADAEESQPYQILTWRM